MSLRQIGLASACAIMALTATTASAEVKRESFYLSAMAGAHVHEGNEPTNRAAFQLNFRANYNFTERWGVQFTLDNSFSSPRVAKKGAYMTIVDMSADVVLYLWKGHAFTPYIAGGPGVSFYKDGLSGTDPRMLFNTGAGFYIDIVEQLALRFDMRTVWATGPVASYQTPSNVNFNTTIGLTLKMGGRTDKDVENDAIKAAGPAEADECGDSDNDGVKDCDDACPTAAGTAELKGCPAGTTPPTEAPKEAPKQEPASEATPSTTTL